MSNDKQMSDDNSSLLWPTFIIRLSDFEDFPFKYVIPKYKIVHIFSTYVCFDSSTKFHEISMQCKDQ